MNELILHDEKQAKQLARKLAQVPGMSNVKLFQSRHGVEFRLAFDCQATRRDPLLTRAIRAMEMVDLGYQLVWLAPDNGLVIGPKGQAYAGDLATCACQDLQRRLAQVGGEVYRGPCKHSLYRAIDLLIQANRAQREQAAKALPARKPAARRAKAPVAAHRA